MEQLYIFTTADLEISNLFSYILCKIDWKPTYFLSHIKLINSHVCYI